MKLAGVLTQLERTHGKPRKPRYTDAWELVLLENVAYLVDDERRAAVFDSLRKRVGLKPTQILAAPHAVLLDIVGGGMLKDKQVEKLRTCAQLALDEFDGDVSAAAAWPLPKALRAFKKFPGLGEPGAARILLFSGQHAVFALESNGVRVLTRLGFATDDANYARLYKALRAAVEQELAPEVSAYIRLHQLLRLHGQTVCRRSLPDCDACPLAKSCSYVRRTRA